MKMIFESLPSSSSSPHTRAVLIAPYIGEKKKGLNGSFIFSQSSEEKNYFNFLALETCFPSFIAFKFRLLDELIIKN